MKYFLTILLIPIVLLMLVSCGNEQEDKKSDNSTLTVQLSEVEIPENTKGMTYEERSIGADIVLDAIKNREMNVIDVRTEAEFLLTHFDDALNIPYMNRGDFAEKVKDLDRNRNYLLHCAAGVVEGRSYNAAEIMDSLGFEKVYNLKGGFMAFTNDTTSSDHN